MAQNQNYLIEVLNNELDNEYKLTTIDSDTNNALSQLSTQYSLLLQRMFNSQTMTISFTLDNNKFGVGVFMLMKSF